MHAIDTAKATTRNITAIVNVARAHRACADEQSRAGQSQLNQSVKWLYCVYVLKCAATIEPT